MGGTATENGETQPFNEHKDVPLSNGFLKFTHPYASIVKSSLRRRTSFSADKMGYGARPFRTIGQMLDGLGKKDATCTWHCLSMYQSFV